jgi:hypothetical protein
VHRHVTLPISSGDIGLILVDIIVLVAFLGSWALVVLVITFRFLLDSYPFLLEAIGASNLGSFPFHVHLRLFEEFLPLIATTHLPYLNSL